MESITPDQSLSQPPTPPAQPFSPLQSDKSGSKLPIIILSIVTILSLGGLVFFYTQIQSLKKQVEQSQVPQASASSEVSVAPEKEAVTPSGWSTYTNTENSLTIGYPPGWYANEAPNMSLSVAFENEDESKTEFIPTMSLNLNETKEVGTDKAVFTEKMVEETLGKYREGLVNIQETSMVVDGHDAYQLLGEMGPGPGEGTYTRVTLIQMTDKVLIFSLSKEKYETEYSQMLSSLKFTN